MIFLMSWLLFKISCALTWCSYPLCSSQHFFAVSLLPFHPPSFSRDSSDIVCPTESRCGAHCVADTVHYRCTVLKDEMISPSNRRFLHKVTNFYVDLCGSSGESAGRLEIAIISIYGAKWPERSSWHVQGMASECTRFQSGLHDEIKSEPCCQDIVWNLCAVDIY